MKRFPSKNYDPRNNELVCDALIIKLLTVKEDRIVCTVELGSNNSLYSNPELALRLCEIFPNLPAHICKNAKGSTFESVMQSTSLPHLFEHLVIDLQVQDSSEDSKTFVGTSEWIDEQAGIARVEVSFTDDLVALRAFRDAAQILNKAML